MHVHVLCPDGEAKFWLEPTVGLAKHYKLTAKMLNEIQKIIEEHGGRLAVRQDKDGSVTFAIALPLAE